MKLLFSALVILLAASVSTKAQDANVPEARPFHIRASDASRRCTQFGRALFPNPDRKVDGFVTALAGGTNGGCGT